MLDGVRQGLVKSQVSPQCLGGDSRCFVTCHRLLPCLDAPSPPPGHDNGDIRLWNLDTQTTQTLRQHTNAVTCLAMALLHRNEELLLSAGYDGWVVLWDVRSLRGEEPYMVSRFRAHGTGAGGWGSGGLSGGGAGAGFGEGAEEEGEVEGSGKAGVGGRGRGSEVGGAGEAGGGRAGGGGGGGGGGERGGGRRGERGGGAGGGGGGGGGKGAEGVWPGHGERVGRRERGGRSGAGGRCEYDVGWAVRAVGVG